MFIPFRQGCTSGKSFVLFPSRCSRYNYIDYWIFSTWYNWKIYNNEKSDREKRYNRYCIHCIEIVNGIVSGTDSWDTIYRLFTKITLHRSFVGRIRTLCRRAFVAISQNRGCFPAMDHNHTLCDTVSTCQLKRCLFLFFLSLGGRAVSLQSFQF